MAWIDMWTGVWSELWGTDVPEPNEMGDFYNTQVEIYADTAFGTLTDIINARLEPSTLSELKGHGAGSFKVSKNDPKVSKNPKLLDYRNYVKIRLNGVVIGGFIIQNKKTTIIGAGEERDEVWEVSGEGPRSWTRDASVYPPGGLKNSSAETRYFNFSTERGSWYNESQWVYATMRWAWNNVANGAPKGHAPANWPDAKGARWIWNSPYDGTDPQGYCYFRHEFTTPGAPGSVTSYAFFIAADDAAEVYVDGEQKAVIEQPGWHETTRVELELEPGPHVIGVKAYNYRSTGPGEILTALFTYGDPEAPTPAVLVNHSGMANTWRVNAYPAAEPGWTIGDVLLTLLNEAKDRGVRFANNFTPTFSTTVDSSGAAWADPVPWSFEVGTTYEDVISAAEELGCDIWVDPDTLEMHAWAKRGADRSLAGLLKGPLVEARRNYNLDPRVTALTEWNTTPAAATITATSNGARVDVTAQTSAPIFFQKNNISAISGDRWSSSVEVEVPSGYPALTLELRTFSYGSNTIIGRSGDVTVQPGTTVRIEAPSSDPVPSTSTGIRSILYPTSAPAGARLIARKALMEKTLTPGTYFDGSFAEDQGNLVKYRFVGPVNASESVMEVPSQFGNVVVFSPGHNLVAADETGQAEIANTLMLRTPEGWTEKTAQDELSLSKYGRVETQLSTKLTAQGATSLVQELFRQKALPEISATFDIVPVPGMIPFLDFNVGDWVSAPSDIPGVKESRRVMSIAFTEDSETGLPLYAVEFDTIFKDRQAELEKWLSRVSNSSAIGGGFTNSSNLPPTVVVSPPGTPAGAIPDPPTGLVVSSLGKWLPDGTSSSDYGLTWNAVISGTGFGTVEVTQYEVWGRLTTESESHLLAVVFDSFAYLPGFRPGDEWAFKVRAISRNGGPGDFSGEVALVAEIFSVALGKPSAPILTTGFGTVSVKWDGLLAGNPAPPYVRYVRVERKLSSASTWQAVGALINFGLQDLPGNPGESYDYRFVAVDIYGRPSTPSDPTTITVTGVDLGELDQDVQDAIDAAQDAADAAAAQAGAASDAADQARATAEAALVAQKQYIANPDFLIEQNTYFDGWNKAAGFSGGRLYYEPVGGYLLFGLNSTGATYIAENGRWYARLTSGGQWAVVQPGETIRVSVTVTSTSASIATVELRQGGESGTGTVLASAPIPAGSSQVVEFNYTPTMIMAMELTISASTNGTDQYVLVDYVSVTNITDVYNAQQTAMSADRKVTWSVNAPTSADATGRTVGAVWFRTSGNNIIGQWELTDSGWVSRPLDNAAIANLNAGKINAGFLDVNRLEAGSISASKLLITNMDNMVEDSGFEYHTTARPSWTLSGGASVATTTPRTGSKHLAFATSTSAFKAATTVNAIAVEEGDQYRISAWIRLSATGTTSAGNGATLRVDYGATEASTPTASPDIVLTPEDTSTSYVRASGVWTVPAGAKFARLSIISRDTVTGKVYCVDDVSMYKMSDGELIVDGAITAQMIGAEQVTATHLSAGSIATEHLQAQSIVTEKLAADSVTANEIAAGSIETNHIVAGAIQVSHLSPSVGGSIDISANESINLIVGAGGLIEGLQDGLDSTSGDVEALYTYYNFTAEGAVIGKAESAFKLKLKNDRVQILENDTVVSEWDSGRMRVDSFVGEEVVLGNHMIVKENGGTVVRAL